MYLGEAKGLIYLRVRFATTPEDLYLTHDGGLIISEKASIAMAYNYLERDRVSNNTVTKSITGDTKTELKEVIRSYPADIRIEAGDLLTPTFDFPTDGYLLNPEIRGRTHFSLRFEILKRGQIGVGDKLLGLTGLKGIVCKVDPDLTDVDIIINPNQVYGDKETRKCGSAIKEIQKSGRLAVFFQPRHLASSRFSDRRKKVTVSSTAYPFIALYGSRELQEELLPNQRLADLFYMLDLTLDGIGKIRPVNRQAKPRAGGEMYAFHHYLWKKDFIKEEIWLPNWLPKSVLQKRGGIDYERPSKLIRAISDLTKIGELKPGEATEKMLETALVLFNVFRKEIAGELVRCIAPIVKKGRSNIIAVPKAGKPYEIELTRHDIDLLKLKVGAKVLLRREPVVSKYHIQEFSVQLSTDRFQQNNTVKIVPEAIRLMAGDFDGDPLILMNYKDVNFRIPKEVYEAEKKRLEAEFMPAFKPTKINVEDLYKTDDELINAAEEEHTKQKTRKHEVPLVGGRRKGASFSSDSLKFEEEEIVNYAIFLEEGLKDTMPGKFAKIEERSKKDQLKLWLQASKKKCALKLLWKKYRGDDLKGSLLDKLLGLKFLTNDRSGLYKHLISKIERSK